MKKFLIIMMMIVGLLPLSSCDFAHNTNISSLSVPQVVPQVEVKAILTQLSFNDYQLKLTATIPKDYYIYSIKQVGDGPRPTNIKLNSEVMVDQAAVWTEKPAPIILHYDFLPGIEVQVLLGEVEWTLDVHAFDVDTPLVVTGTVTVYPCNASGCLLPQIINFTTK
jgi:hypothetical protein